MLPPALISLTRLLMLSESDFKSARSKGKLPKGKLRMGDGKDNTDVLEILDEVFRQREEMYIGGSVEARSYFILTPIDPSPLTCFHQDDERLLSVPETPAERKRHAVIVRLGEKRILRDVRQTLKMALAEFSAVSGTGHGNEKDNMKKRDKKGVNGGKETGDSRKRANGAEGDRGWKKARK